MNILVTNLGLNSRSGTVTVTRNLVLALKSLGHTPVVYSPNPGETADEIRQLGITVVSDIGQVQPTPDIIHGHHTIETATAAVRFPEVPVLFVCHDVVAWHDSVPRLPNVALFATISKGFKSRLKAEGIPSGRIKVILNAVDTDRYKIGPELPAKPKRALIFAKNLEHVANIKEACSRLKITADTVGHALGETHHHPYNLVPDYDLVFTSALSAIECMATGRAVVVCDGRGLAGFANPERYPEWRKENFGLAALRHDLTVENIMAEIARYDKDHAAEVTRLVRKDCSLKKWGRAYVTAYQKVIANHTPILPDESRIAAARFIQTWSPSAHPELFRQ